MRRSESICERMARWSALLRMTAVAERLPRRNCLVVVNYHRIGNAAETPYDPATFSATEAELDEHIRLIRKRFAIVSLAEAIGFAGGRASRGRTLALITFDDGYIDNYRCAWPVLRARGAPAVFFLPTAFIGTSRIPWWDAIAWQLRNCTRSSLRLRYPAPLEIALNGDRRHVLRQLLAIYKQPAVDSRRFVSALGDATGVGFPETAPDPLFMNWRQAAEMAASGMDIGSHTHTHELLSRMSDERQYEEFRISRETLRDRIGTAPDALAFPVGAKASFTEGTRSCLQRAGYRAAFSFYGGLNFPGRTNLFDIRRIAGDMDEGHAVLRLRLALAAAAGHTVI